MRKLAPVELLLKQTAVGDGPGPAAQSVLVGAVVRLLVDKAYKLRQVGTAPWGCDKCPACTAFGPHVGKWRALLL